MRFVCRFLNAGLIATAVAAAPSLVLAESLEEALATAYLTSPTLAAAQASLRAVNEGVPQALSDWRPTVTLGGSVGVDRQNSRTGEGSFETLNPNEVDLTVSQSLYRGGRTVAATRQAEAEVQAERALLADTEQQLLLDAVQSYMDVWRDEAILRLNINNEQVLARQLEASRDRFEVGEITRTDVAQSEARLSGATSGRIEAESDLKTSRATYEEIIGRPPGTLDAPESVVGLPPSLEQAITIAVQNNPSVVSNQFLEISAREAVREAIGELLPELSLEGQVRRSENVGSTRQRTESASVFAELRVPLYQAGFVSSQIRQTKQLASERRLLLEEARRDSEQFAIQTWEALVASQAQIDSFTAQVEANEIALEGVRQENAVGSRTTLDVLDAEQELLDSEIDLVTARRDEVVAAYALLAAIGRLRARDIGLPVEYYDEERDYLEVRDAWYGWDIPADDQ